MDLGKGKMNSKPKGKGLATEPHKSLPSNETEAALPYAS